MVAITTTWDWNRFGRTMRSCFCSDGSGAFDVSPDKGFLDRLVRYSEILYNQVVAVRKRWLMSNFLAHELEGASLEG